MRFCLIMRSLLHSSGNLYHIVLDLDVNLDLDLDLDLNLNLDA